jgi:hypothetical protein
MMPTMQRISSDAVTALLKTIAMKTVNIAKRAIATM